jgi:LysR family glycine cleavage system transcriptional activator
LARNLPPLSTLRAFEAAARLGSVTRAAEELSRTHGAVSRQVRALQDHAGVALFEKAGTGLKLTPAGEALRGVTAQALDDLEQGYRRVRDAARGPSVHVACSATFAMRWLVPHMAAFSRARPDVRVRLSMTSAREIRHEGADLVLAWDWPSFPAEDQARAIRVADVAFGPVCAPDYGLEVAADGGLSMACRIAHDFTTRAWDDWQARSGVAVAWTTDLTFPHTHLCIEAALSGLGVALVERRLIGEELAGGRLAAPCGFLAFEQGLAAIPAAGRPVSAEAMAFVDWLRESLGPVP